MNPLDELGLAITNAGYTWTPEMRKAYEKGSIKMKKHYNDEPICWPYKPEQLREQENERKENE